MTDRRKTPMNDRVVASDWAETDAPAHLTRIKPRPMQIARPLADLCRAPDGPRDRQLLMGDTVDTLETRGGWTFLRAAKDGYVGYVEAAALESANDMTHWVCAPATHLYPAPDFKRRETAMLSLGARVRVLDEADRFAETPHGFIPRTHLRRLGDWESDPIDVAARLLGTPYLWGGNSRSGIDCSGLVQAAMLACGLPCEGDSDQQEETLGHEVPDGSGYAYGDLLFWKGHVGFVAGETLLHANAGFMATVHEPLQHAISRIRQQGDGEITRHRRL